MDVRVCFRIRVKGDDGQEETHGMCLEGFGLKDGVTAEQIADVLDKQKLIDAACLTGIVTSDQMELITPEEFDAEFGDDLIDVMDVDTSDA